MATEAHVTEADCQRSYETAQLIEAVHETTGLGFSRFCDVVLVHQDVQWTEPVLATLCDGVLALTAAGRELVTQEQRSVLATLARQLNEAGGEQSGGEL